MDKFFSYAYAVTIGLLIAFAISHIYRAIANEHYFRLFNALIDLLFAAYFYWRMRTAMKGELFDER